MKTIYDFIEKKKLASKTKRKQTKNVGFENLKNTELKYEFENCMKVKYNPRKHIKLSSLGFKSIYQLDNLGKRRWNNYFNSGGKVYIISYSTKLPLYKRILFDKKIKKYIGRDISLPLKPKPIKREYVIGGKNGKVFGFNFYLITDEKLLPKQRKILLNKSENYISFINNEKKYLNPYSYFEFTELDSNATDLEIVEEWNRFFQFNGYRFPEFEKQWFKLFGPKSDFDSDNSINNVSEINISTIKFNVKDILNKRVTGLG